MQKESQENPDKWTETQQYWYIGRWPMISWIRCNTWWLLISITETDKRVDDAIVSPSSGYTLLKGEETIYDDTNYSDTILHV